MKRATRESYGATLVELGKEREDIVVLEAGADIATIPYNLYNKMFNHPLTISGIEKFVEDYEAAFGK